MKLLNKQKNVGTHHLNREYLAIQVVDILEAKIRSNELKPGDRLPSERDLTLAFNVSRITIRAAITMLEQRGLVERRIGSGTYIKEINYDSVYESLERFFHLKHCSYENLIKTRLLIEPEIAAEAAVHATPEDLQELRHHVEKIEAAFESGNYETPVENDIQFHEVLARACGNELLCVITLGLHGLLRNGQLAQNRKMLINEGAYGHRLILQAVQERDPERARREMKEHMGIAMKAFLGEKSADSKAKRIQASRPQALNIRKLETKEPRSRKAKK